MTSSPLARCCGSRPFSTYTQKCSGGRVVSLLLKCGTQPYVPNSRKVCCSSRLYSLRYPTAKCCKSKPYSTYNQICSRDVIQNQSRCGNTYYTPNDKTVCCFNRLYKLPYPTASCCGRSPYSTYKNICSGGRLLPKGNRCGNRQYTPNSRTVCCNNHIYIMSYPTARCCGRIPYSTYNQVCSGGRVISQSNRCGNRQYTPSSRTVCCSNRIYTLRYPTAKCCGHIPYSTNKQVCSGGRVKSLSSKCGNRQYTPSSKTVCCYNSLYTSPYPIARCCGRIPYTSFTHICSGGKVMPKQIRCGLRNYTPNNRTVCCYGRLYILRNPTASCCGRRAYSTYNQICSNGRVFNKPQKCGDKTYTQNAKTVCCSKNLYHLQYPTAMCCGSKPYSTYTKLCIGGKVIPKQSRCGLRNYTPNNRTVCCYGRLYILRSPTASCCGSRAYSTYNQQCSRGRVTAKPEKCGDKTYTLNAKTVCCSKNLYHLQYPTAMCCGSKPYSSYNKLCRGGKVLSKPSKCGSSHYIPNNRTVCCYGRLYILRNPTASCCGRRAYSTYNQQCSRGSVLNKSQKCGSRTYIVTDRTVCCNNRLHMLSYPMAKCCGHNPYSSYNQVCVGNRVSYLSTCASRKYNPATHKCCDYRIVSKLYDNARCCGYSTYDPTKHVCCSKTKHTKKTNHKCCHRTYYDIGSQICCGYAMGLKKTQRCCRVGSSIRICKL